MENEEILNETENVPENTSGEVEQAQQPKTFTQEEVNAIVGSRTARTEAKIRKEYERKYGDLESVLVAGTGKKDLAEITEGFRSFYGEKGVNIPKKAAISDRDIEILAGAEADDIIRGGYEDVVEEVERLTKVGAEKMTAREKAVFRRLAAYRQNEERNQELQKIGVTEDVWGSPEFAAFASKFSSTTPVADVYDIYRKTLPQKEHKPMGSMKSTAAEDSGVKDFYSYEDAKKFTKADFDKNPELYKAVVKSMQKW